MFIYAGGTHAQGLLLRSRDGQWAASKSARTPPRNLCVLHNLFMLLLSVGMFRSYRHNETQVVPVRRRARELPEQIHRKRMNLNNAMNPDDHFYRPTTDCRPGQGVAPGSTAFG